MSGEVSSRGAGSRSLSARQVELVNAWLVEHRSGWFPLLVTDPLGDFFVTLRRDDGESGTITFYPQDGWRGALTATWSDGGDTRRRQGSFEAGQVAALRRELEKAQ